MDHLSPDQRAHSERVLHSGEHVRWTGVSDPGRLFSRGDLFLIPFSLLWTSFAAVWLFTATQLGSDMSTVVEAGSGIGVLGWLVGGFFVLFGLYLVAGRFLVKARRKKSQAYVLTNERAIILKPSGEETQRLSHASVSTERSRDGRYGTVRFTQASGAMLSGAYENSGLELFARGGTPFAFYDVADPDPLFEALRTVA